jgi:hypothetical protein
VAQQQAFQDQLTAANRQAAISGRGMNDPILRARLGQEQTRQQGLLEAQQGAFGSQLALALPTQRAGFAEQRANQALRNQAALFEAGQSALGQERQFRLASGTRFGTQTSGGGVGGAISGALGGAGAGLGIANLFQSNQLLGGLNKRLAAGGGGVGAPGRVPATMGQFSGGFTPNPQFGATGGFSVPLSPAANPFAFGGQGGTLMPTQQFPIALGGATGGF